MKKTADDYGSSFISIIADDTAARVRVFIREHTALAIIAVTVRCERCIYYCSEKSNGLSRVGIDRTYYSA
jgi:hypothetical protein